MSNTLFVRDPFAFLVRVQTFNASLRVGRSRPDLTGKKTAVLADELQKIVENDRYPFSPRMRTLSAILAKLRPEPVREPLPPPRRHYEPPRFIRGLRRRWL